MSEIVTEKVAITTTGSAGSASGNADSPVIPGFLLSIFFDFHASAPATTDVTVSYKNTGGTILQVANNATDNLYAPLKQGCDANGAAISGVYVQHPVADALAFSVAQCDALTNAVVAYIKYLKP